MAEKLSPDQREFRLQLAVVKHLDSCFKAKLEYYHIPNRPGDAADGHFKKLMGSKAGASDLVVSWNHGAVDPSKPFLLECGLIELKAPGGTLSSPQNKFLSRYHFLGWKTAVCYSVRQVHDALVSWGIKAAYNQTTEPDYRSDDEKKRDAIDMFRTP